MVMLVSLIFLVLMVPGDANDVTRDFFGDIFRMRDCHNGSRCDDAGRRAALPVPGRPCYCQCSPSHLAYREDKQQCVKDIKECYMSVFYRPFTVEAIPLVYLPTSGQLVHPDAHLSLSMRRSFEGGLAKCRVSVSQYLTRDGFRTLSRTDGAGGPVFGLFTDANKTFLQFLGSSQDRKLLQQNLALVRLLCVIPQYPAFETCVAIRVGWVPGVDNEDVPAPSNKANMMVVGLSLGVLALVYIFAVLVYLKIRRQMIAKQKSASDQEAKLQAREDTPDKMSSIHHLEASSRLDMYHSTSLGRLKHGKKGYRNNCDPWNQMSPIVETYNRTWTDRMGQHSSEFRAQDFKLQPEFFEPEFMASPPHEVLEYLERLQNSITFARHRMRSCYRYQPTLNGIPEDDYFYQELEKKDLSSNEIRTTPDGGSASSVGSLQEAPEEKSEIQRRELPKIPPRKPKRKTKTAAESTVESAQNSDQEQKEIQNAMNTLNDTLDALEYDIYKQEMLNQTSDSENANLSCQNSTSIDFDDFETSSCSSLSAATILGRDGKRMSDISKCSQYFEKNQSEEFSTFSNSTFSLTEAMKGLFHDGNKASSHNTSDISNNSRCPSQIEIVCQPDYISNPSSRCPSQSELVSQSEYVSNHGSRCPSQTEFVSQPECTSRCSSRCPSRTEFRSQSDRISSNSSRCPSRIENASQLDYISNHSSRCPSQTENASQLVDISNHSSRCPSQTENASQLVNIGNYSSRCPSRIENSSQPINISNHSSRCPSNSEFVSQTEHFTDYSSRCPSQTENISQEERVLSPDKQNRETMNIRDEQVECHNVTENAYLDDKVANNIRPKSRSDDVNSNNSGSAVNTLNRHKDKKTTVISGGLHLKKSPSTDSMATVATDMTSDSLDSRCTSPNHPSPTPSLMELWMNKLVTTSVPYSKTRRKCKKKLVLPEDEIDSWEHVCKKHKDPCQKNEMNDSDSNLIDKLTHYGSKTKAGYDVAGYFQSLKQDVLKEHLKVWLGSNNQNKRNKKSISMAYSSECSHTKPLVTGQESNLVDEHGMHLCSKTNSRSSSVEALNDIEKNQQNMNIMDDSLEPLTTEALNTNGYIYYGQTKETNEKIIET